MTMSEKVLRWFVIAGVFALPLVPFIVSYTMFFPYITGKNFTFRILVELMAGAYIALAVCLPQYRPRRSLVLAAFALFVLIIGIADALGAMPFKSFWSNYERMEGWVTLAHLLVYLVVVAGVMNAEKLWQRLWTWSLSISAFFSLIGLAQIINWIPLGQGGGAGLSARIDVTFGNPIYLGVYMLFHVFLAALLWAQAGRGKWTLVERFLIPLAPLSGLLIAIIYAQGQLAQSFITILFGLYFVLAAVTVFASFLPRWVLLLIIMIVDTLALSFSGTRGAMLGLIGGALLALILYAFSQGASKRMRYTTVAIIAALLVVGGGLRLAKDTDFVRSIVFLNRLSSLSLNDSTTKARIYNMGMAWQGIKERPILGWGQENYAIVFDKYYDPRMYAQEQWFDRVHSSIFDWWIAGGTLGLLSYLAIFGAAIWTLFRSASFSALERSILIGVIAGDFAQNLTVFDNITSWIFLTTILGYIVYRQGVGDRVPVIFGSKELPKNTLAALGAIAIIASAGIAWIINEPAHAANKALIVSLAQPQTVGDLQKSLALYKQSISYGTFGMQEAREQLAQRAMQVVGAEGVPAEIKQQFVETAVSELELQAKASPLDARFPLFAGGVLDSAGAHKEAAPYLLRAHELSPGKQVILFQLGQNAYLQGDTAAAISYVKEAYELEPNFSTARDNYSALLLQAGRYPELVSLWTKYIEHAPSDTQGYYTLAELYYRLGEKEKAIAALTNLGENVPAEKAKADLLIQQVRSGTVDTQ